MERAVSAAHGLPGVEGCADLEALRAEVEPPAATLRQEVETLENQLQEVEALAATGKYSAAKELAEQVAQQAEGVDYLPVQAHALHELGSAQERVEDPKAIETTRQAFTLALQARDDRRAIMAAIDLAHAHGTILRDDAVGRSWSDIGAALVARIGGDTRFEIGLATVRAVADVHAGRFSEAEAGFEHALHMQRKDDPENPNLVVTLMNFGGYHGERQNYAQARKYMGEALELSERLLGRHHPRTLSLYANLGLIAVLSGDHAEAEAKLTETYALQATVLGKEHLETARTLVGLAVAKRNLGKIEEAIELHREALAIRQAKLGEDHPEVCESLQNLATALSLHGESEEALALSRRALELVQKRFGLDDVATANAHRSLGALLVHMDRYSEGREHAASAVRIHEAMGGSEDPELIESLRTLGTAERELGRVRMALALHERALALSEANPHPVGTAYSRWALAKTLRVSGGEESRARALAQEALESLEGRSAEADVVQHIREWLRADLE
jgi:tetratricopeptide (TPR) repeat protein